jgi:NAD+ synthase (glutamine-hydrolysing)
MKIALAQLNYIIGDFNYNTRKIIDAIHEAKQKGADLVVFAELCVCGYPPRDFLEFSEFIGLCEDSVKKIAAECKDIACIIGLPVKTQRSRVRICLIRPALSAMVKWSL